MQLLHSAHNIVWSELTAKFNQPGFISLKFETVPNKNSDCIV